MVGVNPNFSVTVKEYDPNGCGCAVFSTTNNRGPKRAVIKSNENGVSIELYPIEYLKENNSEVLEIKTFQDIKETMP